MLTSTFIGPVTRIGIAGLISNRQLYDHLTGVGVAEGRNFSPVFNANFYRNANPDLGAAGLNNEQLFEHFRAFGLNEGRQAAANFQASFYLASNPDLAAAGLNFQQAVDHYILWGIGEGRIAAPGGVVIQPPPPPPPPGDPLPPDGSTLSFARDLGIVGSNLSLSDSIGPTDRNDYYRFTLPSNGDLKVTLSDLTGGPDVELSKDLNLDGEIDNSERLKFNFFSSGSDININQAVASGTYFLLVSQGYTNDNTNYTLQLDLSSQPSNLPIDPGNTLATALDLGVLKTNTFRDFVGDKIDQEDYYRFTLSSNSEVYLTLNSLTDSNYAGLKLIQDKNNNGQVDSLDAIGSGNISQNLVAGTYFIQIFSIDYPFYNTNYELQIGVESAGGPQNRRAPTDLLTNGGTVNQEFIIATDIVNGGLDDVNIPVVDNFTAPVAVGVGPELGDGFVADVFGTGAQSGDVFAANPLDANFNSDLVLM
ncbi:PPC domain-containing protein [[Phormidium] sp. ETS-05]|uniref:PPC domain-containing protein n=1 Tax=[Phormidium] sp. ETS-05 TaxID=222819 RepID=UPI0018EF30B6|nr:PPC domain-containing protein [[Phormidium] sp. ETS-05]